MSGHYQDASSFEELASSLLPKSFGGKGAVKRPLSEKNGSPDQVPDSAAASSLVTQEIDSCNRQVFGLAACSTVEIKQHRKAVVTLDLDRSGARLATGSLDYSVALYDFAGMSSSCNPFRFFTPADGSPLRFLRFSPTGEFLMLAAGSFLRLLDRHGGLQMEYRKGDSYLHDMRVTQGHVGNILAGDWLKTQKERFASAGQDGTIRFWDAEAKRGCEAVCVVKANRPGRASPQITQLKYLSRDAIVCGASDGALRLYSTKSPWISPTTTVAAHEEGATISGLAVSRSGHLLASRATDDTLKRTILSSCH